MGVAEVGVAHFLALNPRTVAEHDVGDIARGGRGINRAGVARANQAGQPSDVVVVGVRNDHRIERTGVEREVTVGAVRIESVRVKQPAVEQQTCRSNLQQMGIPVICRAAPWNVIRNQAASRRPMEEI